MDVHDLLASLVRDGDRAPRAVIDECARHGAGMVDALDAVVGPTADWSVCELDGHWWLRLHAAFILGLMEDAAAGRLLLRLMQRLAAGEDGNLDDWLAAYWPALLRNKPDSILPDVEAFAWAHHATPYLRPHAVEVLLAASMRQSPEALDASLARTAEWIAGAQCDAEERALTATVLLDFPRPAHRALLENLAALQKGGFGLFGLQDVEAAYAGPDKPGWLQFDDPWEFYAPDRIDARQERWAAEDQRRQRNDSTEQEWRDEVLVDEPYVRETPKVGRNEPCPCGSGRKYKKCCLSADSAGGVEA